MSLPSRKTVYPIGVHNRQRVVVGTITKSNPDILRASPGRSGAKSVAEINPMSRFVNLAKAGTLNWEKRKVDSLPNSTLKLSKTVKTYKFSKTMNGTSDSGVAPIGDDELPQEQTFLTSNLSHPWNTLKILNTGLIDEKTSTTTLNIIETLHSKEIPVFRKTQKRLFSTPFDEKTYKYNQCANQPGIHSVTSKDLKPELFTEPDPEALAPFKKGQELHEERKVKIALNPTPAKIIADNNNTTTSYAAVVENRQDKGNTASSSLEKTVHSVYLPKTRFGRTTRPITVGLTVPEVGAMVCEPKEQFLTTQQALEKSKGMSYYMTDQHEFETFSFFFVSKCLKLQFLFFFL